MTDDRPRPKYGEYAPISQTPVQPEFPPPVVPVVVAAPPRRRTWDVALTVALLLIGVWDVAGSFSPQAGLGFALKEGFKLQGMGEFTSMALAAQVGGVVTVIRLVILVITIVLTLFSLSRNRISFWIPLVAGAVSLIVLMVGMYLVVVNDPAFVSYLDTFQS